MLTRLSRIVAPTARAQVLVIGAICFACPGMYNAITSLAGGIADPAASVPLYIYTDILYVPLGVHATVEMLSFC